MQRREFVSALGLTAVGLVASQGAIAKKAMASETAATTRRTPDKNLKKVMDTTADCLKTGNVCLAHCQSHLATGDTSLAECQKTVMNMLAVCDGLLKIASYNNCPESDLKNYAKLCSKFCRDCEKACEKHAGHHAECKACYDSCKNCADACDTFAA